PPVRSPCVSVCALDRNDICIACHRSGMEISQWGAMSNTEKRQVLGKVARRERGESVT
ncbi:MAG: DUF1289 domain-containing protein, partial [Marinobacterium sp.]|nr:DUF1289 domain-containing protein [Marinobacterium sp.]MCV6590229.1 DUF1289 domain-containing protein [Marinobacterium sp.]